MTEKKVPFTKEEIEKIIKDYPTPFHIYDEKAILDNAKEFIDAFSWAAGFKEYFAVKALPNPHILKLLASLGIGADCSSIAELYLSEMAGIKGEDIMFTSNDTPAHEYKKAYEMGAVINLDDITHIEFLEKTLGKLPELLCFRYNPGPLKGGNDIIGKPEEAKYGLTRQQMIDAYKISKEKGVKRFAMHTMVASNELNPEYFAETAVILFQLAADIYKITGPYGYLVTRAIHEKHIYKEYIGLDACMANLMRPALYGAYHHITVMGKENAKCDHTYDVSGSLCENNDKFAVDRKLPKIDIGDIVVIHDTGAHGHAMGFNYNGKLRSAELLLKKDGSVEMIRRAETLNDLFATLKF